MRYRASSSLDPEQRAGRGRLGYRDWLSLSVLVVTMAVLGSCGSSDESADTAGDTTSASAGVESVPSPGSSTAITESASGDPTSTSAAELGDETATTQQSVVGSVVTDTTVGGWAYLPDRQLPPLPGGKSAPILSPLPDGVYWSWTYTSDGYRVDFTLSQYFTGDACTEQFGNGNGDCASDNNTLFEPSATVSLSAGAGATTVVASNADGSIDAYSVSPAEFARLVAGAAPASDAPSGFAFQSYHPVILTVRNGQVISADQVFTS